MSRRAKAAGQAVQIIGDKAAGRAIAAAREAFNEALAGQDYDAIADVLSDTVTLVPGDEADILVGRDAQLDAWRSIFGQASDAHYVRSPARIEISEDGVLAAESGRWRGGWSAEGMTIRYNGRYFGKWRFDGLKWRIESETFVTMKRSSA